MTTLVASFGDAFGLDISIRKRIAQSLSNCRKALSAPIAWQVLSAAHLVLCNLTVTIAQDCLDRTNVVQCAFAKRVLSQQLRNIGVLGEKEQVDDHEEFMGVFRNGD
jgi:hypothetical protein